MNKKIVLILPLVFLIAACSYFKKEQKAEETVTQKSVYNFVVKDIDGNEVKLDKFQGQVLLIVNTASKCGFTPQYEELQNIYERYKEQGFTVLGFPSNDFKQEPEANYEIKAFCESEYGITFPMFSKISVTGEDKAPLFEFLTETNPKFSGEITWNFTKFLIDRNGNIVARFEPKVEPKSSEIITEIEKTLGQS